MRKLMKLRIALAVLAILPLVFVLLPRSTGAQTLINPVPFYEFRVSDTNLGFLYTRNFDEGANAGFVHTSQPVWGNVYPQQGVGTVPLHRWRVQQSGRAYYYYTPTFSSLGSGYFYEGIAGYVFPAGQSCAPGCLDVHVYYSQTRGYWYSRQFHGNTVPGQRYGTAAPPIPDVQFDGPFWYTSYRYQGVAWRNPQGPVEALPPPPPPTDADGDGYNSDVDCNDNDSSVWPGAPIYCEFGQDRNCNGQDDYQECYGGGGLENPPPQ